MAVSSVNRDENALTLVLMQTGRVWHLIEHTDDDNKARKSPNNLGTPLLLIAAVIQSPQEDFVAFLEEMRKMGASDEIIDLYETQGWESCWRSST